MWANKAKPPCPMAPKFKVGKRQAVLLRLLFTDPETDSLKEVDVAQPPSKISTEVSP